ncbi:NUDIX hydrolase [Deinococcus sp.]|uniref:NUDIX hydrolase n=1 Tax=Deinococcus sp. TaxID=47478 RepID=UPI003B5997B9
MTAPDIDFQLENLRFSLRAAVIVIRGGFVLVCREPDLDVCYLPGGRIQAGEDSLSAARRELLEETGQDVGQLRLALICEDFAQLNGTPFQGIAFYYVAETVPDLPAAAFANLSAEDHWFEWVSLGALDEAQLVPPLLRDFVLNLPSEGVRHVVSRR